MTKAKKQRVEFVADSKGRIIEASIVGKQRKGVPVAAVEMRRGEVRRVAEVPKELGFISSAVDLLPLVRDYRFKQKRLRRK